MVAAMDTEKKTAGVRPGAAASPAAPAADAVNEGEGRWEWLEDCQSFLASTAVHLVALILLGLLAAAAPKQQLVDRVEVQLGTGDDAVKGVEGLMKGVLGDEAKVTEDVASAVESDLFDPEAMSADVPDVSDTATSKVAAGGDPFGETSIASDLCSALGAPGLGGEGLGDVGAGKDPWSGEGSPWGKDGPGSEFFGIEGRGGSFVYVVDMSGSMNEAGKWERATDELLRSIKHLDHGQRYFIDFFSDNFYAMDADHPVLATPRQLDKTTRWVKRIWPGGGTFPLEALLHALSLEPDAIYFLSDGRFDPAVIQTLKERNPRRFGQVPIHAISFVNRDTVGLMKQIAKDSGGKFRFVE